MCKPQVEDCPVAELCAAAANLNAAVANFFFFISDL